MDHQLSRNRFLRQVGLDPQCSRPQKICTINVRGRHWSEEHELATILNGDFCAVTVRDRPLSKAPTLTVAAVAEFCTGDETAKKSRSQQSHPSIETQRGEASNASQSGEPGTQHREKEKDSNPKEGKEKPNPDDSSLMQTYQTQTEGYVPRILGNNSCGSPFDRADYDFQAEEEARLRIIQQGEEEIRTLIEETVEVVGEFNIMEEIRGLRDRRDPRIGLLTHGLAERHLGTKRVEIVIGRALDLQHICRKIIDAWLQDIQWQRMKIFFVSPQPFEIDPDDREWIHLLVDFRPDLIGTQLLVRVAFIFHSGEEGELEATRTSTPTVPGVYDRLGLMPICDQNDATCLLSVLRVHFYQPGDRIPLAWEVLHD